MAMLLDMIRLMSAVLSQNESVLMVRKMMSSDDRSRSLSSVSFSGLTRIEAGDGPETMMSMIR